MIEPTDIGNYFKSDLILCYYVFTCVIKVYKWYWTFHSRIESFCFCLNKIEVQLRSYRSSHRIDYWFWTINHWLFPVVPFLPCQTSINKFLEIVISCEMLWRAKKTNATQKILKFLLWKASQTAGKQFFPFVIIYILSTLKHFMGKAFNLPTITQYTTK